MEYGSAESYQDFVSVGEAEIRGRAEKDIEELWE